MICIYNYIKSTDLLNGRFFPIGMAWKHKRSKLYGQIKIFGTGKGGKF